MRRLTLAFAMALLVGPHAAAALTISTRGPQPAAPHVDGIGASLTLRGRAPAGAAVGLRARCALGPCTGATVANNRGRWTANLDVVLGAAQRTVRVRAASGNARAARRIRLTVAPTTTTLGAPILAVIGDSLSLGTDAPLRALLPDFTVTTDGRSGRPLAEGMQVLDWTPITHPIALAFSLFTNDGPNQTAALDAAVTKSLTRTNCAIWATIVRPPVAGFTYGPANRMLRARDDIVLVDWARAVRRHPKWMSKDGVHPNTVGYAGRARLFAAAARKCPGRVLKTSGTSRRVADTARLDAPAGSPGPF